MGTPLYNTDIIPMTSRPTLTVMDDEDYFVILDTSTGKISKILRTNIQKALNISYDNTTSGLTAETVQAALDELVVNLGSSDDAILALGGRLNTLEGTGEGSVAKAIDDAVSPVQAEIDTNRLYSDSQYLDLKAKADSLQVKCNTLQAEVYTDDPILQYGAIEIIGDGYEADDSPIDVSANVVDGKLELEQKGLTITNLSVEGQTFQTTIYSAPRGTYHLENGHKYYVSVTRDIVSGTDELAANGRVVFPQANDFRLLQALYGSWTRQNVVTFSGVTGDYILFFYGTNTGIVNWNNFMFVDLTAHGLSTITDTDILAKLLPYVDGTKNVGKMGIQILDADDAVTQTIFLPTIGNSLPNGTADSINTVADGWEHTKRVSDWGVTKTKTTLVVNGVNASGWQIEGFTSVNMEINSTNIDTMPNMYLDANGIAKIYAENFQNSGWTHSSANGEAMTIRPSAYAFYVRVKNSSTGVVDGDSDAIKISKVQSWLRNNPITFIYQLATPITTHYDLPLPTSGKTIHRFAGEEKIALYGTGLTFSENVFSVLSAIKFVSGVMTDITSLATITTNTVTFSGVNATDVVYAQVEHNVDKPLGVLEHTPAVSNTASRLASLESRVSALEV